ncbi:hypothetical protein RFI_00790 [Reticulomyxa filosa]|uniref:Uncharacterized protein n=1 Tax=Reticulomyxa filosa TaxID=46433 RepID=X6PF17_RETFI|nr:hypothetical protein RFI_00790 [Reticulomyxa filosa]|eukprot:ETO36272.1 hypothetical protein RFI_00790 [Reticulomyxa filosa]
MLYSILFAVWCLNNVVALDLPSLFEGSWILQECLVEYEVDKDSFDQMCDSSIVHQWVLEKDANGDQRNLLGKWYQNETSMNTTVDEQYMKVEWKTNLNGEISLGPSMYDLQVVLSFDLIEMTNGYFTAFGRWSENSKKPEGQTYQLIISEIPNGVSLSLSVFNAERNKIAIWSGKNQKIVEKSFLGKYGVTIMLTALLIFNMWARNMSGSQETAPPPKEKK